MKINSQYNLNLGFTSRNSPIRPFQLNTSIGGLKVVEMKLPSLRGRNSNEFDEAANFLFNEAIVPFQDFARNIGDLVYDSLYKRMTIVKFKAAFIKMLQHPDGNTTILLAKDSNLKIRAFFSLKPFDEFEDCGVLDNKTAYVHACYVDGRCRNQGVGSVMLDKLLETAQGHFSDIYLEGRNKAVPLYKRAGFEELDTTIPEVSDIADFILEHRNNSTEITLLSKPLDTKHPWWKRVIGQINTEYVSTSHVSKFRVNKHLS